MPTLSTGRSRRSKGFTIPMAGPCWGWAEIAARVQRFLAGRKDRQRPPRKVLRGPLQHSGLPAAVCSRRKRSGDAREDPRGGARRNPGLRAWFDRLGEDSWKRLDGLYQQIETDLGRQMTPLARPDLRTADAGSPLRLQPLKRQPAPTVATPVAQSTAAKAASAPAASSTSPFWLVLGFLGLGGRVGGRDVVGSRAAKVAPKDVAFLRGRRRRQPAVASGSPGRSFRNSACPECYDRQRPKPYGKAGRCAGQSYCAPSTTKTQRAITVSNSRRDWS